MENKLIEWTDKFAAGNLDLAGRQDLKVSLESFKNEFRRILGLLNFPHDILKEKISRLNHNDTYSKALSISTVQNMYFKIMLELEGLEQKRDMILKLQADYELGKESGISREKLSPLSDRINIVSEDIEVTIKRSESINEFLAHLDELVQEIYRA